MGVYQRSYRCAGQHLFGFNDTSHAIALIGLLELNDGLYLLLSSVAGFGFGGNFVLFAKQTVQVFGISNFGVVYPYVFLGYAVAGIVGPLSGGLLYDYTGYFLFSGLLASLMSFTGGMIFFIYCLKKKVFEKKKDKILRIT